MISRSRKLFRLTLVLLIVSVPIGQYWYQLHREAKLGRPWIKDGVPDADMMTITSSGPMPKAPESAWLAARTRRHADLLKRKPCDVLVVPVQVEGYAFDRPNRDIMSWDLANALSAQGQCVTDPALVDIALGDGQRRRDPAAILELARSIKARQVVSMFAGHDVSGQVRLTLQSMHLDPDRPTAAPTERAHSLSDFSYSAEHPPFLAVREHLGELLDSVGLKAADLPSQPTAGVMPAQLPSSPAEFIAPEPGSALADAANLAFLAMLAPTRGARTADRLFAKAWVRLQAVPAEPAVIQLRARIMFHLHERPYALSLLKSVPADQAAGLRALLDGNLPEARAALAAEHDPWERFFLDLEVRDLENAYQRHDAVNRLDAQFADSRWRDLVNARWGEGDVWMVFDSLPVKKLLDQLFPIPGFSFDEAILGNAIVSRVVGADQQLLALQHLHRVLETAPDSLLADRPLMSIGPLDLIDMILSRVEHGLVGQTRFHLSTRGDPETGAAYLRAYDVEFAGEPSHELLRADLEWKQLNDAQPQQRPPLMARLQAAAYCAISVDQGQSRISKSALWYLQQPTASPAVGGLGSLGMDYPIRDYWNNLENSETQRLEFSATNSDPLLDLKRQGKIDADTVASRLEKRFRGEPAATEAWLKISRSRLHAPEVGQTPEVLSAAIEKDPDNWSLYFGLAMAFRQRGEFDKAAQAIWAYPLFRAGHSRDAVLISNRAYENGTELLMLGAFDAARPLLQRAADLDTGSQASIMAGVRLGLLEKNYRVAATQQLTAAKRYNSFTIYGDFLRLMFASGHDSEAWAIYDQITSRYSADGVVAAAMVGNRRKGTSDADLGAWLKSHLVSAERGGNRDRLAAYALREAMTDRDPAPEFSGLVADLAGPADVALSPDGHIYPAHPLRSDFSYQGPSDFGASRHDKIAAADAVPHRYALVAEAFDAFRARKYEKAVAAFDRLSSYYYIEVGRVSTVLPYFAYAAAQTGDTLGLEQYLASIPDDATNFNVLMARAVFASVAGRKDASYELLDHAFLSSPYDIGYAAIDSAYIYMDICALLYERLKDPQYRAKAFRAARILRVTDPAESAAHALVGYLGEGPEQVEALAMALYLDPRSAWASKAPEAIRHRAESMMKDRRFFDLENVQRDGTGT